MTKLTRVTGKVFGGSAPLNEIGQFGSALAGNPTNTQDVATIQALDAYSKGWGSAVISSRQFPPIEEVTGALKTISYQGCYLLQEGIPEYDIDTEYSNTSIVKSINNGITTLYVSLANGNKGNALSNSTYWKPYVLDQIQRNIGEIVTSTIPLTDAGLHLLDGALLQYGSYQAFIDYIAELYDSGDYTAIFETEANWQTAVTTYGVCGKFVYDSVNNTVRLPKYNSKIYTGGGTAPVIGNGLTLGLTDGTVNVGAQANSAGGAQGFIYGYDSLYGQPVGTSNNNGNHLSSPLGVGVVTDPTKSGLIAQLSDITTSLDGYYYIVVATSTKTDIEVDIDEIVTDLNGKADVDLTNVNNSGTSRGASWAMPSDTYEDLTLGASGTDYTAPANGWFTATGTYTGNYEQTLYFVSNSTNLSTMCHTARASNVAAIYLPVKKGEQITLYYDLSVTTLRFVYAVGSESEAS